MITDGSQPPNRDTESPIVLNWDCDFEHGRVRVERAEQIWSINLATFHPEQHVGILDGNNYSLLRVYPDRNGTAQRKQISTMAGANNLERVRSLEGIPVFQAHGIVVPGTSLNGEWDQATQWRIIAEKERASEDRAEIQISRPDRNTVHRMTVNLRAAGAVERHQMYAGDKLQVEIETAFGTPKTMPVPVRWKVTCFVGNRIGKTVKLEVVRFAENPTFTEDRFTFDHISGAERMPARPGSVKK